jgi:predicted metal-dependent hydrolase
MTSVATAPYRLVRSRRRRRTIEISISPSGELSVAAPLRAPLAEIEAFVASRQRWIERALRDAQQRNQHVRRELVSGERLPYLGGSLLLDVIEGASDACLDGDRLIVACDGIDREANARSAIEDWYRDRAAAVFAERVELFAPQIGVRAKRVVVREQKTRWGSCGKDATIYLNWHLVLAPLAVVDYLVVHELCHIKRGGHGVRFWQLVERVLPDYKSRRRQLRRDGWRYKLGAG